MTRFSIDAAAVGVRSWKSWKVIEPVKAGSLAPLDVWVTLIVMNWPLATVALTSGLLDVTE